MRRKEKQKCCRSFMGTCEETVRCCCGFAIAGLGTEETHQTTLSFIHELTHKPALVHRPPPHTLYAHTSVRRKKALESANRIHPLIALSLVWTSASAEPPVCRVLCVCVAFGFGDRCALLPSHPTLGSSLINRKGKSSSSIFHIQQTTRASTRTTIVSRSASQFVSCAEREGSSTTKQE